MPNDLFVVVELEVQDRRLQVVEARVEAPLHHFAVVRATMVAQHAELPGDFVVVRYDGATVAEAAKDLRRIEAEHTRTAEGAGEPLAELRAKRLRRVLKNE